MAPHGKRYAGIFPAGSAVFDKRPGAALMVCADSPWACGGGWALVRLSGGSIRAPLTRSDNASRRVGYPPRRRYLRRRIRAHRVTLLPPSGSGGTCRSRLRTSDGRSPPPLGRVLSPRRTPRTQQRLHTTGRGVGWGACLLVFVFIRPLSFSPMLWPHHICVPISRFFSVLFP